MGISGIFNSHNSLFTAPRFNFVMDERVIFLWYPCHVYVCAFMSSLYSTLQNTCKYSTPSTDVLTYSILVVSHPLVYSMCFFLFISRDWIVVLLCLDIVCDRSSKRQVFALINRMLNAGGESFRSKVEIFCEKSPLLRSPKIKDDRS